MVRLQSFLESAKRSGRHAAILIFSLLSTSSCAADQLSLFVPPLKPSARADGDRRLGFDDRLWGLDGSGGDRTALLRSLDYSLAFLQSRKAAQLYRDVSIPGVTLERVRRSLLRFRELVFESQDPVQLRDSVRREFQFLRSVGKDGEGTVKFTAYYSPSFRGSRVRTERFRYPLYLLPQNFNSWSGKHPTRRELEGEDGLTPHPALRNRELCFLESRLDAFLIHVQGSARIELPDGQWLSAGFAGATEYPFTSIGQELVRDGKMRANEVSLGSLKEYFARNPKELDRVLPKNNRFVFFRDMHGSLPRGSLGVPVTAERSIATDKSMMPPGALALIHTTLPVRLPNGQMAHRLVSRYVLDQDTGSAIRTPGRVDIYMGVGDEAGDRAGQTNVNGELFYLLLREDGR